LYNIPRKKASSSKYQDNPHLKHPSYLEILTFQRRNPDIFHWNNFKKKILLHPNLMSRTSIRKASRTEFIVFLTFSVVYFWFGILKFFPGLSPAEGLAIKTIEQLTFGVFPDYWAIKLLAIWEVGVAILLLIANTRRIASYFVLIHLVCTFTPLFLFPELCFTQVPYGFTLLGQYIVKNIVFVSALLFISFSIRK
jgi:uncharacterized membrane protein YkgB